MAKIPNNKFRQPHYNQEFEKKVLDLFDWDGWTFFDHWKENKYLLENYKRNFFEKIQMIPGGKKLLYIFKQWAPAEDFFSNDENASLNEFFRELNISFSYFHAETKN